MNIYLDVDGVLLANEHHAANHAADFIRYVVSNFPTYWLTSHCQGDASVPLQHIVHLFDQDVVEYLKRIRPTSWDIAKTEAIDFGEPFLWFDDDLFPDERDDLIRHNALSCWVQVNLRDNPDMLGNLLRDFPMP